MDLRGRCQPIAICAYARHRQGADHAAAGGRGVRRDNRARQQPRARRGQSTASRIRCARMPRNPRRCSTTRDVQELEALRLALPQLARLDRYMQRALSRRARAMRAFVAVSVLPRAIKVEWSRQLQLLVAIPQNEAKELRNFKGYTEKAEKSAGEYWSV